MTGIQRPAGHSFPGDSFPYYSQWESPELVPRFLDGSLASEQDPRWRCSGARTAAEYAYWARKVCGLACLKMILAARPAPVPPMMCLVERALSWRAFIPVPGTDRVQGLIYRPFADWVAAEHGIAIEVAPDLPEADLLARLQAGAVVIASVHPWVRWPDRTPPVRGGHLVLVTGSAGGELILNNPSGLPGQSQQGARIAVADFGRFYAGRGMIASDARSRTGGSSPVTTLQRWMDAACAELGIDPAVVDQRVILDLTRDVAHQVDRPAAPLTAFLLGLAAGRGAPLAATAARLQALAAAWPAADAAQPPAPPASKSASGPTGWVPAARLHTPRRSPPPQRAPACLTPHAGLPAET
ncbi:MAG: DUF6457 domain-containing protein [Actinomycetota bacterium]